MQPESNPKPKANRNYLSLGNPITLIVLAIVVVVAVGGVVFASRHKTSKPSAPAQTYKLNYSELEQFTITSPTAGSGMAFKKPQEVGKGLPLTVKIPQVTLNQMYKQSQVDIADITAMVLNTGATQAINTYKQALNSQNLSDTQSSTYKSFVHPAAKLVNDALDPAYGLVMGAATHFTNNTIKSDAWQVDFSAVTPNSSNNTPKMQGKMVVVLGKNAIYYFTADAVDYNWQANQSIWQQVLSSLKVDQ
jgi:flagellar basal body-associated protein FliL